MTHCTVYSNTSDADTSAAGAIYVASGAATLENTIIASNPGGNCGGAGTITDGGGNLQFGDDTCGAGIPIGDPKLGALADNGGPTPTMALAIDSPAVDACTCTSVTTDQRGTPRPIDWSSVDNGDGPCDIGAYESLIRLHMPITFRAAY
jgi:hypothetical protein